MAYRYQKINPQSQPLPVTLSTMGSNGSFEFNIGAGTTFNLSKSLLNLTIKINSLASNYPDASGILSQYINRIQLVNSSNEIIADIQDAYSYSANMSLNCNNESGYLASQILVNTTQAIAERNLIYNINKIQAAGKSGADTASSSILNPVLYYGSTTVGDTFFAYSSDFNFMYPKTFFSLDQNIHTKENLRVIITLNPVDLAAYFSTSLPSSSYQKTTVIPEGTSSLVTFFINLYILPNTGETNFTKHVVEPEIQKISVQSNTIHNVRVMLKPKKEIGFIAWSPYATAYQTGSNMFSNTLIAVNRDSSLRQAIASYDIRLSGNPLVQSTPVNCLTLEYMLVNRIHYEKGILEYGQQGGTISYYGFVDYTTFDNRGIFDWDANDTTYLSTEIPLELTNDVVLSVADLKQHQFVIGYKKTIKSENGLLSVVR